MAKDKPGVGSPIEYPKVARNGYYTKAFKKEEAEKKEGKRLKREWEDGKQVEYGSRLPSKLIKKIPNPSIRFCNLTS